MITIGLLLLTLYATTSVKGTPEYRTAVAVKCGIEDFSDSIPVGVKSYKELVKTSKMFVDNSLLIEEIIRNETKTKTIIGPRKFGKTLNLDMIRIFFEIQAHKNGTEIPLKFTFGYNLFQKGKIIMGDGKSQKLDSPLLISQRRELLDEYQGRVPVIFLNLKNVTGNNYDEVEKSLHRLIAKAYQQYSYVVSNITDSEDQSKYRDFSNGVPQNTSTIIKSLQFLCEHVRNYFRRAPLLIFDDYESALYNIIYAEKFPRKDINAVSHLTISLLNTSFDGNPNIWKGIIMGTFKVYPEVIDSAENLACYDRYDTYYYNIATKRDLITYYFGFHLKDVLLLFQEHKIHGELAELAHKWYNGYIDPSKEHRFYNPYSIASFLKTKEIKTYWKGDYIKPEKIDKFMHDSHLEVVILSLLSKCTSSYNMPLVLDEINISYLKTFNGTQDEGECFYSYLMDQGYFAPLNSTNPRYIEVVLANYEMGYQLITWILNYYRDRGDVREDLVNECANKLLDFFYSDSINGTELANSVTKLYWNCAPYNLTVLSHSIFYCIALKMQCLTKFQIEGYYAHVLRGDVVLADNRTGRGAIIQLRMNYEDPVNYDLLPTDYVKEHFDVRIEDDLKTAESFKYNFEEHTSFRLHTKKFIAVKFSYRFPTRVLAKIERRQLLS